MIAHASPKLHSRNVNRKNSTTPKLAVLALQDLWYWRTMFPTYGEASLTSKCFGKCPEFARLERKGPSEELFILGNLAESRTRSDLSWHLITDPFVAPCVCNKSTKVGGPTFDCLYALFERSYHSKVALFSNNRLSSPQS